MKIEDLGLLVALRDSANLEIAARRLGLSQPTLSRRLQAIERELGLPLFWSSGRRKRLSPQAEALCERVAGGLHQIEREVGLWREASASLESLRLRAGGRIELLSLLFAGAPRFPSLRAVEMPTDQVVEALLDQRIDLGITAKVPPRAEFLARKFFTDSWVVAASPKAFPQADLHRLVREAPALAYRENLLPLENLLRSAKVEKPDFVRVLPDWSTLVSLAGQGLGWVLAPQRFAQSSPKLRTWEVSAKIAERSVFHLIVRRELKALAGFSAWWESLAPA